MLVSSIPPGAVILDARFRLADPAAGRRLFAEGHIPGAHYVDLNDDLSGPKGPGLGRHPLPSRPSLQALFSRLGIGAGTPVVCYDDTDHAGAGRAWMLLRWMGVANAFVLDGGLKAWLAAGGALAKGDEVPMGKEIVPLAAAGSGAREGAGRPGARPMPAGFFPDRTPLVQMLGPEELAGRALVDARAPERYRGEVEPLDPKAGHIPGAKNLFYQTLLGPDGRFLPAEELARKIPEGEPVFYCGSGVTASVLLLAATVVGRSAAVYAGSWSQWCTLPEAPTAKGDE